MAKDLDPVSSTAVEELLRGSPSRVMRGFQSMALEYAFDKAKLPRGLSYPLKRRVLDAALSEAKVTAIHCVYYWLRHGGSIVLRADYCGEGRRGWVAAGKSTITVYAVPSIERQATEAALVSEGLPRMVEWLGALEVSGNTRRGVDHQFFASWEAGAMAYADR